MHRHINKKYLVDNTMSSHSHTVLRLPPYHPDINLKLKGIYGKKYCFAVKVDNIIIKYCGCDSKDSDDSTREDKQDSSLFRIQELQQ
ncbi:hypothetical protein PR048_013691 [Dryococelus australis]|uniref:Uncharacterized protein n=1 Tax=Dryococelus australis TaxID=614101 RepID=A0ABQ9HSW4_9NEOP|nr:hypothetical protein PR048_013691 [Dryococelus australis]